jgi:cytochrome P450
MGLVYPTRNWLVSHQSSSWQVRHLSPLVRILTGVLGVDTTAIALTYLSYELAKNPQYFSKLSEELKNHKTVDDLQSAELEKLPLLNAVIREALRLYPPVPGPIATRLCPPEGTTLGGYSIPGGVYPPFY